MKMLIRQIEAFRAVVLTQTTVGAAELLGVSQPAVSRIIYRLESDIGLTLFDRSNGRLVPTPEAQILYREVDVFSRSMDRVKQTAADLSAVRTGHLRISMMPAVALGFLPRVIARFKKQSPGVTITFEMLPSAEIEQQASNQLIDLGIVELPMRSSGIKVEVFCSAPLVAVFPIGHPLSTVSKIAPLHLKDTPLISLTGSQTSQRFIEAAFERAGVKPLVTVSAQTNSLICQMVTLGVGVGIVDPFTALSYRDQGLEFSVFDPAINFNAGILYPSHKLLSKSARFFLKILREERSKYLNEIEERTRYL